MKAYYYQIQKVGTTEVVDEGIIRDSEDTIYPGQHTGIKELPSEVECHHCNVSGYLTIGWEIELTRDDVRRLRV